MLPKRDILIATNVVSFFLPQIAVKSPAMEGSAVPRTTTLAEAPNSLRRVQTAKPRPQNPPIFPLICPSYADRRMGRPTLQYSVIDLPHRLPITF